MLADRAESGRPRSQRPERGSMRTAKASSAANATGHSAIKMITSLIIDESKSKFYDLRGVCTCNDCG